MARVTVVTDSSACLSPGDVDRLRIHVLPITIRTPAADLLDVPEAADGVYGALARDEPVKSSAPSPSDYLDAVEGSEAALVVTPAAEFTTMHRSASVAAEIADRPVAVLDCRTAAAAQGLVVTAAAEAARAGGGLADVTAVAEAAAARADLVAALPGVDHLRRSGRVPAFAIGLARSLGVRPVFRLRDGTVERLGVPRTEDSALDRLRREWAPVGDDGTRAVFHAAAPDRATRLARLIGGDPPIVTFSPAMAIHTGPGVAGIAWIRP